ncbi:MAG: hypothetical protein ISS82_01140 [Nanoarchaeota archaeon]|nr:hypothetical protein [Nanoarchaeota archaeon]
MEKKAQVTMFIILGIVVVAAFIGVFVFKDYIIKSEFEREAQKLELGDETEPVYNYFRDCVGSMAYDGLKIIASHGGYLNIPTYEYPINPLIPFSNRLDVFNDNALEVPYWFYETSNGIQVLQIPSLQNVENDLNTYVRDNIFECINNFTLFEEYNIRGFDDIDVVTKVEDNKVYVKVISDLIVNYKDLEQRIENVYVVVDTDFGQLYKEANDLFTELYYNNFTEEKTIDMLVLYDELPFSFTEFNCERKVWSRQKVVDDFKRILELNTFKYGDYENKYFSLDTKIENDVYFTYNSNWPTYIDIGPGENEILKSDEITSNSLSGSFLRSVFCVNDYKFIYNVKYPVLVTLSSDLDFLFAYQTLIKNNQPRLNLVENTMEAGESKLCLNKIMPTEINVYGDDLSELGNVKITFKCFDTICDIGYTDGAGYLYDDFPQCLNGLIIAEKEGYNKAQVFASTNYETQNILILDELKNLYFEVKLIENGVVRNVKDDEDVQIYLRGDNGHSVALDENSGAIELISDNYEVSSIVTKNKKINIPKQKIKECTSVPKKGLLGLIFKEERCFDIDVGGFDLDNVVIGGNKFNFYVSLDDLDNNKLMFYVNVYGVPETQDEILSVFDYMEGGEFVEGFKYPEYE